MNRQSPYFRQVSLLVRVLPIVGQSSCFALKGGTAINLFYREMPRLSVDIDLVYLPVKDRTSSLSEITLEMKKMTSNIKGILPGVKIQYSFLNQSETIVRIIIEWERTIIKVEVSPVLRGSVFPSSLRRISTIPEGIFGFAEVPVVSFEDLFAGKIVAALDRQHPRDLFDIKYLLENEGITPRLKESFIVYLISHNRRILEILKPNYKNITDIYNTDFEGMTTDPVSIGELERARELLVKEIYLSLNDRDRDFLIGFKTGEPDWSYFSVSHIKELPAVKWKMYNLDQLKARTRMQMVKELEQVLYLKFQH
ncbi:MAG: nucleotidyl transferase AbiEii/AbiGii toxin family protein [Spirochaetia bacterium]|jgi:predicted nucleotidyltransferase component of viral defense system|nr:nucleotidyl transferase AbiEii/AbiGii toxin family protein [Spirochaetia bacterium]